jgi:hypothetical protein
MSTLQTRIVALITAVVGLVVGLGVLSAGVGQDVIAIGGIAAALVIEVVGAADRHSQAVVKAAVAARPELISSSIGATVETRTETKPKAAGK